MSIAKYTQTPDEVKIYKLDYSSWLGTGETLSLASATATPSGTAPFTATAILSTLTEVSLTISGGDVDTEYTVKVQITTSAGQVKEDCIDIDVRTACE